MSFCSLPGCPVLRKFQIFIPRCLLQLLLMEPWSMTHFANDFWDLTQHDPNFGRKGGSGKGKD